MKHDDNYKRLAQTYKDFDAAAYRIWQTTSQPLLNGKMPIEVPFAEVKKLVDSIHAHTRSKID